MPYPESIEVAGIPLERWDAQRDLKLLLTMAGDEQIQRFIGMPGDEAGLAAMSDRFAAHWDTFGFGLWAVRPHDGLGTGWIGACHPRWHPEYEDRVELAWSITPSLRGRGLVTEGARTAASACFAELGLGDVFAFVEPENAPSLAVVRRLGMKPVGETAHPGKAVPLRVFTLARGDLPPV